ncbi:MAG: fumarylacetoacetate hydrolase family protein [Sphingobium sp.]|uniref:fumarylacetoacetate hydrolase family protein n=1 Tax=Sphingobium sp. TaxID=1912891 RepID=UPI0029A86053|nr:fumarylacetoacetate hydrolase family protein [Sphingobium sp.]MDX3911726.1 fumarylacetoacetate hydrolase family protein [Sphingobium sp.]
MFALGTFADKGQSFVGLVVAEHIFALPHLLELWSRSSAEEDLPGQASLLGLLEHWDENFPRLEALARFAADEVGNISPLEPATLRYLPPVLRPGKILHSAANFREHVEEMAAYNTSNGNGDANTRFAGEKEGARPYLFLKASSTLGGPFDDIVLPAGDHQIDWEAELAVVIGKRGRDIAAAHAMDHVAGFMVANDVTCRDMLWRDDRKNFKTDWLASKSHDGFEPIGPLFVPRAYVTDPGNLRITLTLNGVVKQDGHISDMIFSPEEQIEFASHILTLEPGDIFVTGTVGGVGQATGEFLKAGDVVETEVHGLGRLKNRIVAAPSGIE